MELAASLGADLLQKLRQNPPDPEALRELAGQMSSVDLEIEKIGVLTIKHNDTVDELYYLGGYYQLWPTAIPDGGSKQDRIEPGRQWYVDGFAQDVGFQAFALHSQTGFRKLSQNFLELSHFEMVMVTF